MAQRVDSERAGRWQRGGTRAAQSAGPLLRGRQRAARHQQGGQGNHHHSGQWQALGVPLSELLLTAY